MTDHTNKHGAEKLSVIQKLTVAKLIQDLAASEEGSSVQQIDRRFNNAIRDESQREFATIRLLQKSDTASKKALAIARAFSQLSIFSL
ncbi:MAG: hypothetical protein K2X93_15095 [Candidatus Obscuribacterales bacterium]|nr:hypothetical protein [Candidatus Obscuribacterales bacterium]